MICRRRVLALLAGVLFSVPTPVFAQASVFVPVEPQVAWWARDITLLPKKTADGGLTVQQIDQWLTKNRGMKVETKTCNMDFARVREVVSADRATQIDIDETLKEYPNSFAESYEPEPGRKFLVRVGIFQGCESNSSAYMAIVITDQTGIIREIDALDWAFIRLFKRQDGKINIMGCFECGEARELFWDKFNDRFYYEWTGH